MNRLDVDLGERSYPIHIGPGAVAKLPDVVSGRAFVLTDTTVGDLHSDDVMASLPDATLHTVPVGEGSKSFATLESVLHAMLDAGLSRGDTLVALGGGVVGDLGGFAASVFKRGCRLVQVPTTLLSQVDSSVGGKTAVNTPHGKNLVGSFYQPDAVLVDTDLLRTLPERQWKAGYAEILKYALIDDPDFFTWLDRHAAAVLAGEESALARAIHTSCAAKARVVAADERERGSRALLNLGHTFAHALEYVAGYGGDLLHGEAVGAGLSLAFEFSHRTGLCEADDAAAVAEHLRIHDLVRPEELGHLLADPDALLSAMAQDKKNEGGALTLVLARGIGKAFTERNADRDALRDYLHYLSARHA